ncbi:MAG: succinate dehydrogenase / fumarate reductase cytochrome b subunit [Paracoccaceae bacterium]|jgi:succinate dehydrogenase / fumarate reductase cytochrome b subunit
MADANPGERPLSPHLSIYRPQLTSITSILTRITGLSLLLGAVLIVWWLLAAAISPDYYAVANGAITSWLGDLIMSLSLWALWYHYLAGVRHLYFDAGNGLEVATAEKLGWAVIIGSVVLTILTLFIV